MTGGDLGLHRLNLDIIPPTAVCVFTAKRDSGKSTFCEDLLYHMRTKVPVVVVVSRTENTNHFYKKFLPDSFIYESLDDDLIPRIQKRQETLLNNPPPGVTDPHILLIFDDCMHKKTMFQRQDIRDLIMNGRHFKIGVWIIAQYATDLPTYLRSNADFIFAFKDNVKQNREKLWKMFFGVVETLKEFEAIMQFYTDNYGILVCNNRERANKLTKILFWYKAKMHRERWRLGPQANDMYEFHEKHYFKKSSEHINWDSYDPARPTETKAIKKTEFNLKRLDEIGRPLS